MSYGGATQSEETKVLQETKSGAPKLDLLVLVRAEQDRAVGFEQDTKLKEDRDRALNYFKGDMSRDVPALPNRSTAVSSDVSDAIETLLADLIEIFLGGDDVVSFIPQKASDVEPAKQETAYLHHVAFQDNPGFLNLYTGLKDALLSKTGVFHWEWQEDIETDIEHFTGKNAVELQMASQDGEISNVKAENAGGDLRTSEPTYSFTVTKTKDNSGAKYWAVASEDFSASADTIDIAKTTYCVERQRPRVQDLIADGFDEAKVRKLEPYVVDGTTERARDTAGESERNGGTADDTSDDLRQVEIRKHCIRVLGEGDKLQLWCVYTDAQATAELHSEEIDSIPYAVGSPYLVAHRLIGRSVADLLIEIQKIKTAFYRLCLDSGYFAMNQRMEVSMEASNDFTISDLLRNEPMSPVRSKNGQALRPLQAGALNFDPYKAIEFFSTVAEGRTGIVRNAQGLNPDTLHDTATGAMALISAAQKRTRMIARVLAETLIKPLFLGLHACIRENASAAKEAQLLGKWVPVDPTQWAERNSMTVEVGLGASGKDAEIAAINQVAADMHAIVELQGGAQGPIVFMKDVFKLATDKAKKLGVKAPEEYYSDPSTPPDSNAPPPQPKPDPAVIKAQGDISLQQQDAQNKFQLQQQDLANKKEVEITKANAQAAVNQHQNELEHVRAQAQAQNEFRLAQLELASKERIAIVTARVNAEGKIAAAEATAGIGNPDADLAFEESHETVPA